MYSRVALTSGLILASFFYFSTTALAEVTFQNVESGTLEQNGTSLKVLESVNPEILTVTVPSDTNAQITILPPTLISGPSDPDGTTKVGFLKFGSTNLSSNGTNTKNLPTGNTNLEVRMRVERPVNFTPGTYKYKLTLSVTVTPL